jgi:hypothetical protein
MKRKKKWFGPLLGLFMAAICCGGCAIQQARLNPTPEDERDGPTEQSEYEVRGEVLRPGRYACVRNLGLFAALARAGRYTDHGDTNHVRLIRNGQTTVLDVRGMRDGAIRQPIILPGDVVEIPREEKP